VGFTVEQLEQFQVRLDKLRLKRVNPVYGLLSTFGSMADSHINLTYIGLHVSDIRGLPQWNET